MWASVLMDWLGRCATTLAANVFSYMLLPWKVSQVDMVFTRSARHATDKRRLVLSFYSQARRFQKEDFASTILLHNSN
jgi:hypothetical protein